MKKLASCMQMMKAKGVHLPAGLEAGIDRQVRREVRSRKDAVKSGRMTEEKARHEAEKSALQSYLDQVQGEIGKFVDSRPKAISVDDRRLADPQMEPSKETRTAYDRRGSKEKLTERLDAFKEKKVAAKSKPNESKPAVVQTEEAPADTKPVDEVAHEAATSPKNNLPTPTEKQKEAGNYAKGHTRIAGHDISIENPAGSKRRPEWKSLKDHYGYFKRSLAFDAPDNVDVFVKPGTPSDFAGKVHVIDQIDPETGKFDEHKVMLGYDSKSEANDAYHRNYQNGWKGMASITAMPQEKFRDWLRSDAPSKGPVDKGAVMRTRAKAFDAQPKMSALRKMDALKKSASRQTDTPAFKEWFKQSTVVNKDGTPKVMYHGTAQDITEFKPKQAGAIFVTDRSDFAEDFSGYSEGWMSENFTPTRAQEKVAVARAREILIKDGEKPENIAKYSATQIKDEYAYQQALQDLLPSRANIMPLYVSAQNPFDYENKAHVDALTKALSADAKLSDKIGRGFWGVIESPPVQKAIKGLGHDGFNVFEGGHKNLAVYESSQLKSAIGNQGTFGAEDPDIRRSAQRQTDTPGVKGSSFPQAVVDGWNRDAKLLRDALQGPSLRSQGFALGVVPSSVVGQVLSVTKNQKILRAVVSSLPVDVVDLLARKQLTPDGLFRDKAMLENVLAVDGATDISLAVDKSTARLLVQTVADVATEFSSGTRGALKDNAASETRASSAVSSVQRSTPLTGLGNRSVALSKAQEGTAEFARWFGESVVTKDGKAGGEPVVFFHGTRSDINEFDPARVNERFPQSIGIHFASTGREASLYADSPDNMAVDWKPTSRFAKPLVSGANVVPVYLKVENPLIIDSGKMVPSDYADSNREEILRRLAESRRDRKVVDDDDLLAALKGDDAAKVGERIVKASPYDGVIIRRSKGDGWDGANVIVFSPTQAKSATGNTGSFDPANPDIRKSGQRAPSLGQLNPAQEAAAKAVGAIVKPQTKKEAFDKFKANLGLRLRQGIVDQFAAIKEIDPAAYRLARMSKNESGPLEALMMYGKPTIKDGIYDVKIDPKGGFAKVLADLDGEHDRFLLWVAAKRADRLKAEGRENLFTDTDISSLKTLNKGRETKFDKALLALNEYNESTLKIAMDSGLIDQEAYDTMKSQPYVPFYRVMDDGIGASGPRFSSGLKGQSAFKKLKGGTNQLNQDLLSNVMQNWSHLYAASARNRAMDASVAAAEKIGIAYPVASGTKNAVKFMRGGVTQHYLIEDDYLFEAVSAVEAQTPSWMKGFSAFKTALTVGVTASPTFRIRNLIRDSIAVIGQSEIGVNPLTNVKAGMKALEKDSQTRASLIAGGGVIRFGAMLEGSNQTNRLIERQMKKGVVLNQSNWKKLTGQMGDLWDAYQEIGDKAEGANRAALYEQLRAKGKSHAEASFMSRDLMDFSMSGRWPVVRFLAQSIPFLNARIIGLDKLGRSFKDNPQRMYYTAAALSIASIALAAAQGDDEDFKKLEDWRRDAFWNFKVGGMMFSIPKPFELGAIGTLAERTFELAFDKEMTGKRYRERLSAMLTQTFAMSPIPQIAKPLIDVWSNKDSFTGRAIETMGMDRLRPQDRYNERTSAAAKLLGQMGLPNPASLMMGQYSSLSPVQIDSLVKGYFGWLGVTTTSALEYGLRPMTDAGTKPSMQLRDVFLAGSFVESLPSGSSRYVTQFYDQAKEIEQAYASYRDALKRGDTTKAMEIMESDRDKIVKHGLVSGASKSFANYNSQTKQIMASKMMSPDEKRRMLDYIAAQKNRLAESVRLN